MSNFVPSPYQQAIFDFVAKGKGSAMVTAVAGSGKTTTVKKSFAFIDPRLSTCYLVFNKRNADEAKADPDMPKHVRVSTFHSAGFSAWNFYKNKAVSVDMTNKSRNLMDANFGDDIVRLYGSFACKLVSLAKQIGMGFLAPDSPEVWDSLVDHFDVSLDSEGAEVTEGIEIARQLLKLSVAQADPRTGVSVIDGDDMLYMPMLRNVRFYPQDWIFVDEAQDTNDLQLAMLRRMLKPTGRLVAVGDRKQAIYGFRGASASAMDNIKKAFNCVELPLTISYRCSKQVVAKAQTLVPYIEASEEAPEGVVRGPQKGEDGVTVPEVFGPGDAIICRNTAPLISKAYEMIGKGIGCKVLGREIGNGLIKLIEKMKAKDLDALQERLDAWAQRETARFMAKGQEQKAEAVSDKIAAVAAVISFIPEDDYTVAALIRRISDMFSDTNDVRLITLSTVHKAKGLEWERVFILEPGLMPSKWARQAWQQEQEANIEYVAITRAKLELVYLS